MKKYISFVVLSLLALPVMASGTYPLLQINTAALQQAADKAKPASAGAHEDGVVKITLEVESKFDEPYAESQTFLKKCTAVRIAPNYLLASLSCRGVSETAIQWKERGDLEAVETPVEYRKTLSISFEGDTITTFKENEKAKLLLIQLNDKQAQSIKDLPTTNIFVAKQPEKIGDIFDQVIINRKKLLSSKRTCSTVDITHICTDTQCFSVCWKFIDADNGDPIFGLSKKTQEQEFLLGFNAAEPDGERRGSGQTYRFFSQSALDFLQRNIDKNSWPRLQKKIVDETFFK